MKKPTGFLLNRGYFDLQLIQEREGVQTFKAQGPLGTHLIKVSKAGEEKYRKEYEFLSKLNHPNFPKALRFEKEEGEEFYTRNYIEGVPLSRFFGSLPAQKIGRVTASIARALAALHFQGLAHGDLSGENILVVGQEKIFLIDFEFLSPRHQKNDPIRGTPLIMAPELFWGGSPTIQTDLYALGCLLYALIAGSYPFTATDFTELLKKHALETPLDPTLRRKEIPRSLGLLALRLISKEPADRLSEANDVIREINRILSLKEELESAPPASTAQEKLRANRAYSLNQVAIRFLSAKSELKVEEQVTLAELLLKTGNLDELERLLPRLPEDLSKLYRCLLLNRRGRYQEALSQFHGKILEANPKAAIGYATSLYYTGRPEEALKYLEEAEELFQQAPEGSAVLSNFRGNLFFFERRLAEASDAFQKTLEKARSAGAAALEALSFMNLGNVQTALGEWAGALENYQKAAELQGALGLVLEKAKTELNRAGLYRFIGHPEKSEELIGEAEGILKNNPHPQLKIYAQLLMADLEKKGGRFEKALSLLQGVEAALQEFPSASEKGDLVLCRAEIYLGMGLDADLKKTLALAETLARDSTDPLLKERVRFLNSIFGFFSDTPFEPDEIIRMAQKLHEEGDMEFVLDNLMRAEKRARGLSRPWPARLKATAQEMGQEICNKLPADDQIFFRRAYADLWEETPMKTQDLKTLDSREENQPLLQSILEWVRELTGELDLPSLTEKILKRIIQFTNMERGFVIRKEGNQLVVLQSHRMRPEEFRQDGAESLSWSLTREALARGEPMATADAQGDIRLTLSRSAHALNLRAILVLPFRFRGEILGAVYLDSRLSAEHLARSDLSYLSGLADILGLALRNAELFEKTEHDLYETQKALLRTQEELGIKYRYENIIGHAAPTGEFLKRVDKVTAVRAPVLILGESGVGKELIARAVHYNGPLKKGPFVVANCSAIPEALAESEFFGHERGAFTGAVAPRAGLFEQAHQGTLFLDEIGDLPLSLQPKLLRVLQEGEVKRLGGGETRKVQVRILAATHRDLKEEIRQNHFREDLYYRLSVAEIRIPPLRERRDDIPLLIDHFLEKFSEHNRMPKKKIDGAVLAALVRYDWPGNIRELENLINNLCIFSSGRHITLKDLHQKPELLEQMTRAPLQAPREAKTQISLLSEALDRGELNLSQAKRRFEKEEILRILKLYQGKVGQAARHLKIPRPQLSRLIAYHGIDRYTGNKM